VAITILIREYSEYANQLLVYFVEVFSKLYGKENLSYNIQGLLRIGEDVETFGNLSNYSAIIWVN
jgi:hypothetical protein